MGGVKASHDVAIAGGGPAGALLAALLARSGLRVVLLEASHQDKRKICGEYLCPKGVALLRSLGFARALDGRVVRGMKLFSPRGISVEARFPGEETGICTRRDILDPALLGCALGAGAEVRRGLRLEGFEFTDGRWVLKAGGESFSARLLVGADGRQSIVARKLGVSLGERKLAWGQPPRERRVAMHAFVATKESTPEWGEMHILLDGSYVGISPAGKNELNLSLVTSAEKAKGSMGELLSQSANLRERFLPLESQVFTAYPITHSTTAVAGENWALVGDAAGFVDPLTGEGIFQALRSSSLLARSLQPALRSTDQPALRSTDQPALRSTDLQHALARYRRVYASEITSKSRVNRFFQALIRHPRACDWVGSALAANPARANAFIGVIGNVYSPAQGMRKMIFPRSSL